ncbi:hypothetical protein HFP43_34675 [Streptomyces sp. SJ1-7]|nr:hypothetical protein [Streptomyces sp. SJ1-7]
MTTCASARAVITALLHPLKSASQHAETDAHLAVSELISNALRHGGGLTGFKADLNPDATRLRLQVEDSSPEPPRSCPAPDPATPAGEGGPSSNASPQPARSPSSPAPENASRSPSPSDRRGLPSSRSRQYRHQVDREPARRGLAVVVGRLRP